MNALLRNRYTERWAEIGAVLPRPKAILSVSAQWYVPGAAVTVNTSPRTIHDFGRFPRELYEVQYPAPGDPALARRVQKLLVPLPVEAEERWGLDHGTWSVLCHVFPKADIPIVQLGIDEARPPSFHYEIGRRLAPLREEDILIVGSGNLVHNLHTYAWGQHAVAPFEWAVRFEQEARGLLEAADNRGLVHYESIGRDAILSVPTPDHYLPLLYVIGSHAEREPLSFLVEGVDGGSISMLAVQLV
jgi:4,5-DOPA dioxygenase extradiol